MPFANFYYILLELAVVFLLVSMLVSAIWEYFIFLFKLRGSFMKKAIDEAFKDPAIHINLSDLLYKHPLVDRLKRSKKSGYVLPAYMPSSFFAKSIIEVLIQQYRYNHTRIIQDKDSLERKVAYTPHTDDPYEQVKAMIEVFGITDSGRYFRTFVNQSANLLDFQKHLELWFDDYMERVSGWFAIFSRWRLFAIGLCVAVVLNVDAVHIARSVSSNLEMQQKLDLLLKDTAAINRLEREIAKKTANDPATGTLSQRTSSLIERYQLVISTLGRIEVPFGWKWMFPERKTPTGQGCVSMVFGWLITAFACSRGASLWFKLLMKLIQVRSSGIKPPKSIEKENQTTK
jgi:hypothetical protein